MNNITKDINSEIFNENSKIKELGKKPKKKDKKINKSISNIDIENNEKYIKLFRDFEELRESHSKLLNKKSLRIDVKDSPEYLRIKAELNKLKSENENYYKLQNKSLYETINSLNKIEVINKQKIKSNKNENKNINILNKYPIIIYKDINESNIKKMVACECSYSIKYQYEISKTIEKIKDITLDETIEYIINQENLSSSKKTKLKYRLERCKFLYETYGDKLNNIKINISNLEHISKKEWILWANELNNIIKELYPDDNVKDIEHNFCKYVYKKGNKKDNICNKINCKRHRKT